MSGDNLIDYELQRKKQHVLDRLKRLRVGRNASRACLLIAVLLLFVAYLSRSYLPLLPDIVLQIVVVIDFVLGTAGLAIGVAFSYARCPQCGSFFFQRGFFRGNYFLYANSCQNCGIRLPDR